MKKLILISALTALLATPWLSAQNPAMERMESYKIAFFTQRLNLTPGEATKFWPLYNELQGKRAAIQTERAQLNRRVNQQPDKLGDEELTAICDKLVELEVRESDLTVKFHEQIKRVLPPIKVFRFYRAENQFKTMLLKQLQERREERLNPDLR
ncbi:MAG: hypothetical protein JXR66_04040 [Bacteroidales bacterium]|nr:hypothetical protein [Bacteroidales bacterium]MBN2632703.1 hypothetical protein [Bacteroidales bacterium]